MTGLRTGVAAGVAAAGGAWALRHAMSPAVQAWSPPSGVRLHAGPLAVRRVGTGEPGPAIVLLHGLTGSGDWYGAAYDDLAYHGGVVVPDLLGFARSLDLERQDFSREAHLDALDAMLADLSLEGCPLTIVGHSMGTLLALHWAARRSETVRIVVSCPPLYADDEEAHRHISGLGLLEQFFAMQTPLAAVTCTLMCRYRSVFQWVSVVLSPQWPVHLARQGVMHSWPSYLGGMKGLIICGGWEEVITRLDERGVEVVLAEGRRDPVPVEGRSRELANRFSCVKAAFHPTAGHDLPVSHANWSKNLIAP